MENQPQKGDDLHPIVAQLIADTRTDPEKVLSLAMALDAALDAAQGYGTSVVETSLVTPVKFGEIANLASAAFALASYYNLPGAGISLNEAIHSGWSYAVIHGQEFQTPEAIARRLKLVALPFWLLSDEEQAKDDVAAKAFREWTQV